ncbi:MAG: patatin-like phospholipase family protein [Syntrophomonadaceae bacterium]|nr:patatin-like phospholipase family protein [Syntrophomonadaceae bacterium]MDD4561459.1 patatin-like phospholipase family protein [Syntrophomonadaceae bacterium]
MVALEKRPRIALVLGAGSARGLAHIGVLQVFEENHIPFDFIVGSSMGAMVGGIYACGADMKMLGRMLGHLDSRLFFDVQLPRMGFISGKRIKELLNLMTKKKSFEEINIPLLIVATDLLTGEQVVLEEGSITEAVRASISIPGIFHPVKRDEMILVDGAVVNRLPIEVARSRGADLVIAVDVTFGEGRTVSINNTMDVILTAIDIMQKMQFDLIYDKADILIQPAVGGFASKDFEKSQEIIQLGRQAAEEKLDEIRDKINGYNTN